LPMMRFAIKRIEPPEHVTSPPILRYNPPSQETEPFNTISNGAATRIAPPPLPPWYG
jgi:hypothetical protein